MVRKIYVADLLKLSELFASIFPPGILIITISTFFNKRKVKIYKNVYNVKNYRFFNMFTICL